MTASAVRSSARPSRRRVAGRMLGASLAVLAVVSMAAGCSSSDPSGDQAGGGVSSTVAPVVTVLDPDGFEEYITMHPEAPVVNVHIPYEGHIEGTDAFVPFESILDWDDLPEDRSAPLALYCRSGNMSATASAALAAAGYTNVVDLGGGMNAWTAVGLVLVDDDPAT